MPSKSFAPPHTVASIKRHLCKFEGLSDPDKSHIYAPLSSPTPKEDTARLSLYAPSGPGLSEEDPIALLVESVKRSANVTQLEKLPERSDDKANVCYVHYRVYLSESEGDQKSKRFFDESDVSLGRINSLFVAPPHTVGSLKARIAGIEGLVTPNHALYKNMELFKDMNGDTAMIDTDVLSFLDDTYPGSNEHDPIALVNGTANILADQKKTPSNSSANVSKAQAATNRTSSDPTFTKRARLTLTRRYEAKYKAKQPIWLSVTRGEIVRTDGILVSRKSPSTNLFWQGYMAINSEGEKGFVIRNYLELI